jgi:hypothetical protein
MRHERRERRGEEHALRGQPVQVRRLHHRVAGTAQDLGVVLVGGDQQDIRLGHVQLLR